MASRVSDKYYLVPKFKNKNLKDRLRYKKNGRGVHFSFNKIG